MSKHARDAGDDGDRPPKRSRADNALPPPEEIFYARQLQDLLRFNQDGLPQLRHGLASFKAFLESILYHKEEHDRARQISILREYLDKEKPSDPRDFDKPMLGQLWQTWSFANEGNNYGLCSTVAALLALLLKTVSEILDLREYGVTIAKTALQNQHLRFIKRGLEAPKDKDFLISPNLRLLTEISSFDGGVLAREVYKRRESTFDINSLRRNLSLSKPGLSSDEARRRPAIRTQTVRYVLTLLKYLHEDGKIDMLKSRVVCSALFSHIIDDPPDVILEILQTIEQSVLKPTNIPRSAKAALLLQQNLERIREIAAYASNEHAAADKALLWLKAVCSRPEYGILRESGWYPPGTNRLEHDRAKASIDIGLDSIDFYDNGQKVQVRNTTLLSWVKPLRPHLDLQQRELVLTCFAAAPELVTAYYAGRDIQLDPKVTNTWLGHMALLFEVVRLPIPAHLGNTNEWAELPPQISIMIEAIMPRPLNQHILSRYLNHSSDLVSFFATRILVLAFEKTKDVLQQLESRRDTRNSALWHEAAQRLLQRFISTCPPMKDVVLCFRRISDDEEHCLQREAITRLLRLYYEVTPSLALEEKFDISAALTAALIRSEQQVGSASDETAALRALELKHLLSIAQDSPGMKWFSKQGGLTYSPITTLLRIHQSDTSDRQIRRLIEHVLVDNYVITLTNKTFDKPAALDALIASFAGVEDNEHIWSFVDDIISRVTKKPVKYIDDLEQLASENGSGKETASSQSSLLAAVLLEQSSFVLKEQSKAKMAWTSTFLQMLLETSDGGPILKYILEKITKMKGWQVKKLSKSELAVLQSVCLPTEPASVSASENGQTERTSEATTTSLPTFEPFTEAESYPELTRWSQKDLDLAFEDGDISALILCLCSEHLSVRTQATQQLHSLHHRLISSPTHENNTQLALLIGSVVETYTTQSISPTTPTLPPLPYLAGTFATHALTVLLHPTHSLYPKLNHFLLRGPSWRVSRLPNYWLTATTLLPPDEDEIGGGADAGGFWKDATWTLEWLADGLRTVTDWDVLRKGGVFERIAALACSPGVKGGRGEKVRLVVGKLIAKACVIDGGARGLVTRVGFVSWAEAGDEEWDALLRERVSGICGADVAEEWTGGVKIPVVR